MHHLTPTTFGIFLKHMPQHAIAIPSPIKYSKILIVSHQGLLKKNIVRV